jgi:hypothetical protein
MLYGSYLILSLLLLYQDGMILDIVAAIPWVVGLVVTLAHQDISEAGQILSILMLMRMLRMIRVFRIIGALVSACDAALSCGTLNQE